MMRHVLQHKESKEKWTEKTKDWNYESDIDPAHKMFLAHLRVDGHSYVYEKSSEYIKYEEEEEEEEEEEPLSSNMIEAIDGREIDPRRRRSFASRKKPKTSHGAKVGGSSHCTLMPTYSLIPVFKHDPTSKETSTNNELSSYERRLMYLCDKPFDHGEYEHLLRMVNAHKPKMRDRVLRGVHITYPTDKVAKSDLDHHPDFAEKIGTACCRNHSLKLLRGFRFWMEHLAHEGAFIPWKHKEFNVCKDC